MTDILTGLHACTGILAALHERTVTGKGSLVDCSLLESQVSAMSNVASNWLIGNQESQRLGTDHPSIVPYGTVKTKDGRIAIAAGNDSQFRGLCKCLNIPYEEKFKTNADRVKNRNACIESIESVTRSRTTKDWIDIFERVEEGKFAFAPVNNMQQVFSDPQVLHRNMVLECEHKTAGKIRLPGIPVKFPLRDQTKSVRLPPPLLGEHTVPVLQEVLGFGTEDIQELIDAKIVYSNVVT
jgi:succinate--hydroxymethylglutarate CoA-transferase